MSHTEILILSEFLRLDFEHLGFITLLFIFLSFIVHAVLYNKCAKYCEVYADYLFQCV